jgi:hypothetical protein
MEEQRHPAGAEPGGNTWSDQAPQSLPNARLILILGILSIALCWLYLVSFGGIILGVLALYLAAKDLAVYRANPARYSISSLNNVKAGRTCAIIGLIISMIVFLLIMMLIAGILVSLPFWGMIR